MFETIIYTERRKILKDKFDSGIILFLGNAESPANYLANTYSLALVHSSQKSYKYLNSEPREQFWVFIFHFL